MQLIEPVHQRQLGLTERPRQVIDTAADDAQRPRLSGNQQRMVAIDHRLALSPPPLVSAF